MQVNNPLSVTVTERLCVETAQRCCHLEVPIPVVYPTLTVVEAVVHDDVKALNAISHCWFVELCSLLALVLC